MHIDQKQRQPKEKTEKNVCRFDLVLSEIGSHTMIFDVVQIVS